MPYLELVLVVEDIEFLVKKPIEVPKHEDWRWLVGQFEVAPIQVGLDLAISVIITEAGDEGVRIYKGCFKPGWDTALVDCMKGLGGALSCGPYWMERLAFIQGVVEGLVLPMLPGEPK